MFQSKEAAKLFEENYVKEGKVRVSIVLEAPSAIEKGYSTNNIAANTGAKTYRAQLRAQQEELADRISSQVLGGKQLEVVWHLTLAANIISAYVPYEKLDEIGLVRGVKKVIVETQYEPESTIKEENQPNMATGSEMVGGNLAWASDLTGAGSRIAVVDTGLDIEHELFAADSFEHAIEGQNVQLMTASDAANVWDQLNVSQWVASSAGTYVNSKVPFGVNYVDFDLDITHANDRQGEHGSHVAGIAAGNRFVKEDGEFKSSLDTVMTQGEAPDAQLLIMKVFGKGGGAYDSDYFAAIEDAILLGADAVNLSLGSSVAGFVMDEDFQDILDSLTECTNLVWCNSAGNNYDWTNFNIGKYGGSLYADDVNFATGGSPGTYAPTLSVASVENKGSTGMYIEVKGTKYSYTETQYKNTKITSLADQSPLEYVLFDDPAVISDDDDNILEDHFADLDEGVLTGKVAMCYRGSSSFYQKVDAAAAAGAVACVVINNRSGAFGMVLSDMESTLPAISISQADGDSIIADSEETEINGMTAYTGTLVIGKTPYINNPGEVDSYTMSDFSSWGVPGDLSMKPEITAPGGNIYSVHGYAYDSSTGTYAGGPGYYENMSGTSMASPQLAGLAALMAQYIRENDLVTKTGKTARQLTLSLLMSTAEPIVNSNGALYSILKQGSGLANINNAVNARSYVTIDKVANTAPASAAASIADGKVKVELGQVKSDFVSASFTLHNFSDESISYYLSAEFFTQLIYSGFRWQDITPLTLNLTWTVNGQTYVPKDAEKFDFNGDNVVSSHDAQHLLEYCTGLKTSLNGNDAYADFDQDGDIDTYDARLAYEKLNNASLDIAANSDAQIVLTVSGLDAALGTAINGNYIEGYIYAQEGETEDGALGVQHSIPVLGFYGNWTDASMYDKGTYLDSFDNSFGSETRYPYMVYGTGGYYYPQSFLVQYSGDPNLYYFGGNPITRFDTDFSFSEELYLPERNALNQNDMIAGIQYTLIRNSAGCRFFVTDKDGDIIALMNGGSSYAAYYSQKDEAWQYVSTTMTFNYLAKGLEEGQNYTLNWQMAPEYYVDTETGEISWDEVGKGTLISIPFVIDNTVPEIDGAAYDEDTMTIAVTASDNQYISAVVLYTEEGEQVDIYPGFAELEPGEEMTYPFNLSSVLTGEETDPVHFLIEVYDYACNLSTYKVNLNPEEADDAYEVVLNQHEAEIVNAGTLQLSATVYPWSYADETLIWSSSDETLAVVDENGLVQGVAKENGGTVTITATSAVDPNASDSCEVTVTVLKKGLNGIVWDEQGAIWLSAFDISTLPAYDKLNAESYYPTLLSSMTYDENGTLYAVSFDNSDWSSVVYTMDPNTYELTEVGAGTVGYMDICQAPSLAGGLLLAVYGPYVMLVNKATGAMAGYFDFSDDLGDNYFVGIAYEEQYDHPSYGLTDWIWLIDEAGNLYNTGFLNYNGSYTRFTLRNLGQIGDKVDRRYWQSLYYDGEDLYWSRFNYADNVVELIMVNDIYSDGSIYHLGKFGDGVWPVGGLFEMGVNPYFGPISESGTNERHSDAEINENSAFLTEIEPLPVPASESTHKGSLNAVKTSDDGKTADPDKVSTEVKIEIAAEELSKNGLITLEIPETAELLNIESYAEHEAWNYKDDGTIVYGFVDEIGILEGRNILVLTFSKESSGTVTITTEDINTDDEQHLVETVILGTATAEHTVHTYGEPTWEWAEDFTSATATFVCPVDDDTQVVEANVESVFDAESGILTYTATVTFEEKEYTDTVEIDLSEVGYTATVTMQENFNLNLYIRNVKDEDAANFDVKWTFDGAEYEANLGELKKQSDGRFKIQLAKVFSYQMTKPFEIVVTYLGVEIKTIDYSIQKYFENRLKADNESDEMKAVYKAALDYGASAQLYFDGKSYAGGTYDTDVEHLANANSNPDNTITATKPNNASAKSGSVTGFTPKTATLIFGSETSLKIYFLFDGDIADLTVGCDNGKTVTEPVLGSDGRYSIKLEGIRSYELYKDFVFSFSKGSETATVTYSPYAYAAKKWESSDANEARLVQALVAYGDAARVVWGEN
ncbi:MAG: S8 family serine peptidase [Lachnospiraceae bacterium]|nr:S8 family serine peptidase [Lachnospiraceae bacterium]